MNLLILGATGPTGRHVVDLALQSGDRVTVLARRPEALEDLADRVIGDLPRAVRLLAAAERWRGGDPRPHPERVDAVYPTMLTKGPAKGGSLVGERLPMRGNPTISRADVADFLHRAAHSTEWIHRDAVITD
ncbi:NAD(P)H-binding protein [Streptomyces sp. NPDC005303]|uniref:NAD(P)H-binding protein n=1 Tax=Streptomyces sp. NPDC005303 TaxID=3155713 RepID=UPI0033AC0D89